MFTPYSTYVCVSKIICYILTTIRRFDCFAMFSAEFVDRPSVAMSPLPASLSLNDKLHIRIESTFHCEHNLFCVLCAFLSI